MDKAPVVKIEAKFDVAEYQILILSATEAAGLETWLKHQRLQDPRRRRAAAPAVRRGRLEVLRRQGRSEEGPDGRRPRRAVAAALPLRQRGVLAADPARHGELVGQAGPDRQHHLRRQALRGRELQERVHPDELRRQADASRRGSREFYAALFDKTVEANPGAVVTEYAWTAVPNYHCDPCTDADITNPDLMTLGADVIGGRIAARQLRADAAPRALRQERHEGRSAVPRGQAGDRRPRAVEPSRASSTARSRRRRTTSRRATRSATGGPAPIKCKNPQRGVWGGPPDGNYQGTLAASKIAFAPRGKLALDDRDQPRPVGDRAQEGAQGAAHVDDAGGAKAMGFGVGALRRVRADRPRRAAHAPSAALDRTRHLRGPR